MARPSRLRSSYPGYVQAYGSGRGISKTYYRYRPPPPIRSVPRFRPLQRVSLTPIADRLASDRRLFHPDRLTRPVFAFRRSSTAVVARQNPRHVQPSQTKAILAFAAPAKVHLCVRRNVRKQVLHAKGIAGSRGGFRRPRRNEWSNVSCHG